MKAEHDPQVLAARLHLRPHLCKLIADAGSDPGQIADALLAVGEVYGEARPEVVVFGDQPTPVLTHHAVLTIRRPFPGSVDALEATR